MTAAVTAIWARTLQVDRHLIDEQADFYQLGGNSLLLLSMIDEVLTSVVSQGEAEFKDELARIIREPTLAQISVLAREIRGKKREERADTASAGPACEANSAGPVGVPQTALVGGDRRLGQDGTVQLWDGANVTG